MYNSLDTTEYNILSNGKFLVVFLLELHSFSLQIVMWSDFRIPIFFPITAVK